MEFGTPFSFPFKDQDWFKKIIIPGLVAIIPIVGQMTLFGWGLDVARRLIKNEPVLLPEFDFGRQLAQGFKGFVISLVYSIPLIIFILPINLVPIIGSSMDSNTLQYLTIGVGCICGGLALIYAIAMALMLPASLGNFLAKDSLGAGFKIGEVFGLVKAAPVAYLLVLVGGIIAGIISGLGSIGCGVGILLTAPFGMAINGHFMGQAYKEAMAKLGSPM
jgi:hypothetical protein